MINISEVLQGKNIMKTFKAYDDNEYVGKFFLDEAGNLRSTIDNVIIEERYQLWDILKLNFEEETKGIAIKVNKVEELKKASKPLIAFVNTYCSPHDLIMIQQGSIQIFNGEIGIPTRVFD